MSKQQYVNKQIQNMVSFMEQEAAEKVPFKLIIRLHHINIMLG
jgi:hypothetical protein